MALKPEQKMEVALFRFSLIAPLLNNQVEDAHAYLEMISSKPHDVPHYGRREYSAKTIRTWLSYYRQGGLDSLLPAVRKDKGIPRSIAPALSDDSIKVAEALAKIKNFSGITGNIIGFDEYHNPVKNIVVIEYKDGEMISHH